MRQPFKKSLTNIPLEGAHGGSGSRKLILSSGDDISPFLEAMTQGFLSPGGVFDWHFHDGIDEFFVVVQGCGRIEFRESFLEYEEGAMVYIPAHTEHRIIAQGELENIFYFIRVKSV